MASCLPFNRTITVEKKEKMFQLLSFSLAMRLSLVFILILLFFWENGVSCSLGISELILKAQSLLKHLFALLLGDKSTSGQLSYNL
jgi:hypothetical protein